MIIDSHAHLFSPRIIASVSQKKELVKQLHLDLVGAAERQDAGALVKEARAAGVERCLLLPTATAEEVHRVNAAFSETVRDQPFLITGATLHPNYPKISEELDWLRAQGVRTLKLCSFSQGFDCRAPETLRLFDRIQECNSRGDQPFFVVLDTFYESAKQFGTPDDHVTTPARLGRLVSAYPGINFVAAHMGGLAAPLQEIRKYLPPRTNLYLGTSNAAHTLTEVEFVTLLQDHGPGKILFGTDWPWFGQATELELIQRLLDRAGFNERDKKRVLGENMSLLLGLEGNSGL